MNRTELELHHLYADRADTARPSPRLLAKLDELSTHTTQTTQTTQTTHTTAHRQDRRARPAARTRHPRTGRIAIGGMAAAIAVTIAAITVPGANHAGIDGGIGGGVGGGVATAESVAVLSAAAAQTQTMPDLIPRADQFYYIKQGDAESWLSIDGTHDGAFRPAGGPPTTLPGCRNAISMQQGNYSGVRAQPCTPAPAYLADAPTTETAMLRYLHNPDHGATNINGTGKQIYYLLSAHYLRPAARAALFEAATRIPGLHAVPEPTLGNNVIGLTWSVTGSNNPTNGSNNSNTLYFNTTTHAFLGIQTTGANGEKNGGLTNPHNTGIVNHIGQRP